MTEAFLVRQKHLKPNTSSRAILVDAAGAERKHYVLFWETRPKPERTVKEKSATSRVSAERIVLAALSKQGAIPKWLDSLKFTNMKQQN